MAWGFNRLAGILAGDAVVAGVTRNFTDLVPAGSQHYTVPSKSLTGDFILEIDFRSDDLAGKSLLGGPSFFDYIYFSTSTSLSINYNGSTNSTVVTDYGDDALHTLKIVRVSGTSELFVDGVSLDTWVDASTFAVAIVSGNNASSPQNYWQGIISNLKITVGGSIVRNYAIDETWSGPSIVLVDTGVDNSDGAAINITPPDSENFTFDGDVSPNTWTNDGATIVIDVAGT